jgi:hypothetical protein
MKLSQASAANFMFLVVNAGAKMYQLAGAKLHHP